MRAAATIIGLLLLCAGFAAFAWPFPMFTLNEPYLTWYVEIVGSGAALPFVWIVTAPVGVAMMGIGVPIMCWGRGRY